MNFKSREKLLASVAALSLLGISPQQTFAAQITTNQAGNRPRRLLVTYPMQWVLSSVQQ